MEVGGGAGRPGRDVRAGRDRQPRRRPVRRRGGAALPQPAGGAADAGAGLPLPVPRARSMCRASCSPAGSRPSPASTRPPTSWRRAASCSPASPPTCSARSRSRPGWSRRCSLFAIRGLRKAEVAGSVTPRMDPPAHRRPDCESDVPRGAKAEGSANEQDRRRATAASARLTGADRDRLAQQRAVTRDPAVDTVSSPGAALCQPGEPLPAGQHPQQRRDRRAAERSTPSGPRGARRRASAPLGHACQQRSPSGLWIGWRAQAPTPVPGEQLCQGPAAETAVLVVEHGSLGPRGPG